MAAYSGDLLVYNNNGTKLARRYFNLSDYGDILEHFKVLDVAIVVDGFEGRNDLEIVKSPMPKGADHSVELRTNWSEETLYVNLPEDCEIVKDLKFFKEVTDSIMASCDHHDRDIKEVTDALAFYF